MGRPKKRKGIPKTCPNCGKDVDGHANKKYCSAECREQYWDTVNPKGVAFLKGRRSAPKRRVIRTGLTDMIERKLAAGHGHEDDY